MMQNLLFAIRDKSKQFGYRCEYPHYTDSRFRREQTIFLDKELALNSRNMVDGARYEYSDRLADWDRKQSKLAWRAARRFSVQHTPAFYEAYLRFYYRDCGLKLVHIIGGVNVGNGWDYRVYGFIPSDKS